MKSGDHVYVERVVDEVFDDGYIRVFRVGEEHASEAIPYHPALRPIGVWLSENEKNLSRLLRLLDMSHNVEIGQLVHNIRVTLNEHN